MIHEIGVELQARLTSRGVPIKVVDGPEPFSVSGGAFTHERIVIEEFGNDSFGSPLSQHKNPVQSAIINIGAKCTIYAQSSKSGAMVFEHRRRARAVMRQVVVALNEVLDKRKNPVSFTGGGFFVPKDLEGSLQLGGAAYELRFSFIAGIPAETWKGEARPEKTLGSGDIKSTTEVSSNVPAAGGVIETGCGG